MLIWHQHRRCRHTGSCDRHALTRQRPPADSLEHWHERSQTQSRALAAGDGAYGHSFVRSHAGGSRAAVPKPGTGNFEQRFIRELRGNGLEVSVGYPRVYTQADCAFSYPVFHNCFGNNPASPLRSSRPTSARTPQFAQRSSASASTRTRSSPRRSRQPSRTPMPTLPFPTARIPSSARWDWAKTRPTSLRPSATPCRMTSRLPMRG